LIFWFDNFINITIFVKNNFDMELQEKIDLNKQLRAYKGDNSFVLSLQKQLKNSKYLEKVEVNGKMVKVLSEKQYLAAKSALA
jgi:hypothetical protein